MATDNELIIKIKADSSRALKEINKLNAEVKKLSTTSRKSAKQMASLNKSFKNTGVALSGLAASFISFQAISGLITDFAELEQGMVGVAKTTGLSGAELEKLDKGLEKLSQDLKGVSIRELMSVAETAGQLGVTGTKDILQFSKAISMIAVATDLTADQAANDFAIMKNILKEPIKNVEKLGSVMNELTNTSEANASQIVEYTKRIGAQGKIFGLTSAEIMGLGATLVGVGATAEAGGSAVSRVMSKMVSDTEAFAKASKMSFQDFSKMIDKDPVEALKKFLTEMGKLDKKQQELTFKELKISSVEMKKVIQLLGGATDKLAKNLETANDEYRDGTSLVDEYAIASKSLESAFKDINNEFDILKKRLGKELSADIKNLTDNMIQFMRSISAKDVKKFAGSLKDMFIVVKGAVELLGQVNDIAMPDWLGGKDSTVLSKSAEGWGLISEAVGKFSRAMSDDFEVAVKEGNKSFDAMLKSIEEFDGDTGEFEALANSILDAKKANEEFIAQMRQDDPKYYAVQIKALEEANSGLNRIFDILMTKRPFEEAKKSAEEATVANKKLTASLKPISDEQNKQLTKTRTNLNKRVKTNQSGLDKLLKQEVKLTTDLAKLQEKLHSIREDYAQKRAFLDIETNSKIAEVNAKGLNAHQAYKDAQLRADKAYQNAKDALSNGDL
ncbi:MAG: phage tail tape measure protein, partial [Sulfurimonas sp.]|nr:phage tail tape measure protein [Sulfurimonas sp.]